MIQPISFTNKSIVNNSTFNKQVERFGSNSATKKSVLISPEALKNNAISPINTTLTNNEKEKYNFLLNFLKDFKKNENSKGLSCAKQLDTLLKNGILLSKSNDNSTTLDNLYKIATTKRADSLDSKQIISDTLDNIINPRIITQKFGDIPNKEKSSIIQNLEKNEYNEDIFANRFSINVEDSGTCAAASNEVKMALLYPAEYTRWIEGLSSENKMVLLDTKLKAMSNNPLLSATMLNILKADKIDFNFDTAKIKITADKNAYIRADLQSKYWDKGERNIADVLIQSAVMEQGSQHTYNALDDTRKGEYSTDSKGLIEVEKTYVETLIANKEITSLVYQQIDDDRLLQGYNCSFEKIEEHLKKSLDAGNAVIVGIVYTNQSIGLEGVPNEVIGGHEITIVGYETDSDGNTDFIYIDTDDNSDDYVRKSANWLIPKIHHAGYPAELVKEDEKEILKNMQ